MGPSYQKKTPPLAATADPFSTKGPYEERMVIAATSRLSTPNRPPPSQTAENNWLRISQFIKFEFFPVSVLRSEKVCDWFEWLDRRTRVWLQSRIIDQDQRRFVCLDWISDRSGDRRGLRLCPRSNLLSRLNQLSGQGKAGSVSQIYSWVLEN